ncbi:hypothetical protein MKEN_00319900 [Mycena kentingensis (nom. inval.)]|nr:hypothetical protein MKEN_00319900 [Mycena kentingensis (nom. inval.)]
MVCAVERRDTEHRRRSRMREVSGRCQYRQSYCQRVCVSLSPIDTLSLHTVTGGVRAKFSTPLCAYNTTNRRVLTMSEPPNRSLRQRTLPVLTKVLHGSAPFISTFLLIHLSAPMLANLGGSSLASQTMLLDREYYQTDFGEKYLLLAPLTAHTLSGLIKRVVSPPKAPPRPWTSLLSLTGYANMLLFLPVHFMAHRVAPADSTAPIHELSPSELDFEYVKFALTKWPVRSWFLYGGLVLCAVLHTVEGQRLLYNTYAPAARIGAAAGKRLRAAGLALIALPVLSGVWALGREPPLVFPSMVSRFESSFRQVFWYRV